MSSLIEHIQSMESEIYLMTRDGHHAEPDVRAAMERLDKGIEMLHAARRRILAERGEDNEVVKIERHTKWQKKSSPKK